MRHTWINISTCCVMKNQKNKSDISMINRATRVLVFGYFGNKSHIQEGQSVKTRNISRLFKEMGCNVEEFDTESFRYDKLAIFKMIRQLLKCEKLCLLPAYNNLKFLFPILFVFSKLFRYDIYLFTIGGRLHIYLKSLPVHRWMMRRIKCVFNETHMLGNYLHNIHGYTNLEYCPNIKFVSFSPQKYHIDGELHLVFLARIVMEKGIDVIFGYADWLSKQSRSNVTIDFYGMVDPKDKDYFEGQIEKYKFVTYKGVAQQSDIPKILEKYDAMLFPTHYPTEGIPGSVIDAYISGIPVIASDWTYARELIEDGKTGIIIPFEDNQEEFNSVCENLIKDNVKLNRMKDEARMRASEYHADNAKKILSKYI